MLLNWRGDEIPPLGAGFVPTRPTKAARALARAEADAIADHEVELEPDDEDE